MKKRRVYIGIALMAALVTTLSITSVAEWKKNSYGWWYEYSDGTYPSGGLYNIGGKKYAFNESGYMVENAWYKSSSGEWYYAKEGGELATSQWVGNYYVGNDGSMMTDSWIDGYYVGADGAWVKGKRREEDYSGNPYDIYSSAYHAELGDPPETSNTSISVNYESSYSSSSSKSSTGTTGNSERKTSQKSGRSSSTSDEDMETAKISTSNYND